MTPSRARRWLRGYEYEYGSPSERQRGSKSPVVLGAERQAVTFLDLVELLFAKSVLDQGVTLQRLRKALAEAQKYIGSDHPFAQRKLYLLGKDLFIEVPDTAHSVLVDLLSRGQLGIPEVVVRLGKRIDFDDGSGFAQRYWPLGKKGAVVLDPSVAFGAPTIAGTGIRTANIYDFFRAEDDSLDRTASWFGIATRDAGAAVSFEKDMVTA